LRARLGEQELAVLSYVTDHSPATVREVADAFAASHSLARTTLLTVLERLRKKGYLTRVKAEGSFRYQPVHAREQVLKDVVRDFVRTRLGGSVSSFVAYLAEEQDLSQEEIDELRALVNRIDEGGNQNG
jgi:predicted transcriptional regulator